MSSFNPIDNIQLSALQTLIHSIGQGKLSTNQTLPLAQRILSSSIIQTNANANVNVNVYANDATNNVNIDTKRTSLPPSLVKKIQRYYLKNNNNNTNSKNNDKNEKLIKIISNVQRIYHDFIISQNSSSNDSNSTRTIKNVQMVNDTLKILYRLAGTGGTGITTSNATGTTTTNNTGSRTMNSNTNDYNSSMQQSKTTNTIYNIPSSPHPPPSTKQDQEPHHNSTNPMSSYSFKHVQMALQNEEQSILRECIYALQYINGDIIQFHNYYQHHDNNNDSWKDYETKNDKLNIIPSTLSSSSSSSSAIQVRKGLLPFHINPTIKVQHKSTRLLSSGSLDILHICGEIGWLYSRIMNYIHFVESTGIQQEYNIGVTPRALASAFRYELQSYHALVSSFEMRLVQQQQQQQQQMPPKLTCRRLMIELRAPMSQLRTMAMMIDGIEQSLNGGQLLTALYLHSTHGDRGHVSLVNRILYSTSLPWYDMLYDWCINGVLLSTTPTNSQSSFSSSLSFDEFFIQEDKQKSSNDLWHGRYTLNKNQIPFLPSIGNGKGGLLTESLANEILIVGKGINFIRKCLNDSQWTLDVQKLIPQKEWDNFVNEMKVKNLTTLTNGGNSDLFLEIKKFLGFHHYDCVASPSLLSSSRLARKDLSGQSGEIITQSPLERTISAATEQVHKHILTSLFEDHHLLQHLKGLKEILFLGQGDFICTLMDLLHVEFESEKGVDGIYMHNMIGILHEALRSTNAKFLPNFVLQRIRVILLSPDDKASREFWVDLDELSKKELGGWDIFSLGYDIQAPLTAVVHPASLQKYHEVFDLLFRLKRIEWMLNSTWRQSTILNHALQYMDSKYSDIAVGSTHSMKRSGDISRMKRLLRTFSLTRQKMLHFVSNFQSYLMFEVLESGWKSLVTELRNAKTLDEVIHAHDDYLNKIVVKSLLQETLGDNGKKLGDDGIGMQLRKVLSIAYKFCKTHETIFCEAIQSIDKVTDKRRGAERRSQEGKWGFEKADPDVGAINFYNLSDIGVLEDILSISQEFDTCLTKFLSMLHNKVNGITKESFLSSPLQSPGVLKSDESELIIQSDDALRFLIFRLDFSEFYSV